MRILFIGDIVGKSGRDIVSSLLFSLKQKHNIDLTIANAENSAHGKGITLKIYNQLLECGVDYITMGNHTFSKSEIIESLDSCTNMIVPRNHINTHINKSYKIFTKKGIKFCLTNILGDILIGVANESPISSMNSLLEETKNSNIDFYFVDYHGETTAEKRLFAEYYKNKVNAVIGTHTHVQTADERLIDDLAFITDVGMCGPYNSIIGRDIDETIRNKIYNEKTHFKVAEGETQFNAVIIDIDESSKKPTNIERIFITKKG